MRKNIFLLLIAGLLASCSNENTEVKEVERPEVVASQPQDRGITYTNFHGVSLPDKMGFVGTVRNFVGAGVRQEYFVRAYVLGLYMEKKSTDPVHIINADEAMSVRLQMTSALLTNTLMEEKIREGFELSLDGKTEEYTDMIDMICGIFSSEPTQVGDVYDIHYTPNLGVTASKNGKPFDFKAFTIEQLKVVENAERLPKLIETLKSTDDGYSAIPSLAFKKAIWGIWFCDNPVDENLKRSILGMED